MHYSSSFFPTQSQTMLANIEIFMAKMGKRPFHAVLSHFSILCSPNTLSGAKAQPLARKGTLC